MTLLVYLNNTSSCTKMVITGMSIGSEPSSILTFELSHVGTGKGTVVTAKLRWVWILNKCPIRLICYNDMHLYVLFRLSYFLLYFS